MRILAAVVLLCAAFLAFAAPKMGRLLWPLPGSTTITGGHADTRPDHFHGGVDLRARTPLPVVAPTDGWVERLAVQPSGYGRVLYFRMDDGRTAVFGHLSRFVPPLEETLRDSQMVTGTYRVEMLYPEPRTELEFKRGAVLAYTGETGVGPPHLHFEIREGAVQTDPLANYSPVDTDKPVIVNLWWTTASGYSPVSIGTPLEERDGSGKWTTHQHAAIDVSEPIGFFIQTYDPGPWGRHAVPSIIRITVGEHVLHEEYPSRIDLAAPKDFYEEIVWSERKRYEKDVRRLFALLPPAQLQHSLTGIEGWLTNLRDATVTIEVEDRAGNVTQAFVPLSCGDFDTTQNAALPNVLHGGPFILQSDDVTLAWARLDSIGAREVMIVPWDIGFAKPCTLSYRFAPGERVPGLFFYERTASGGMRAIWRIASLDRDGAMSCTILRSGTYGVAEDHDPPTVQFSVRQGKINFKVRDAYSYIDDSTIRCLVDGVTAIAEYEYDKHGGVIWTRSPLTRGAHSIELSAGDRAGNVGRWVSTARIP